MTAPDDGDRPGGAPPSPSNPDDRPPKTAFQDPVKLDRAARIALNALARAGLTFDDLEPIDAEHVRAA